MAIGLNKKAKVNTSDADEIVNEFEDGDSAAPVRQDNKKLLIVIGALVACVVLVLILFSGGGDKNATTTDTENTETEAEAESSDNDDSASNASTVYDEEGETIDPNGINPGIKNYEYSTNSATAATTFSDSDYVKDLNGLDVEAIYHAASIEHVTDYISYETRRALMDEGLELYWLEAEYNGRRYRVQCPFYYFKDLGTTGICKVELEIVHTTDGGKIITYMRVVDDDYVVEEED